MDFDAIYEDRTLDDVNTYDIENLNFTKREPVVIIKGNGNICM